MSAPADDENGSENGDDQEKKPSYLIKYSDAKRAVPFLYRDGTGTATFLNKDTYTGEYKDRRRHGKGTYVWAKTGAKYAGNYTAGERDGIGAMHYPNGARYVGSWSKNKRHGQGTYTYPNGDLYCGNWEEDKKVGRGTYLVASNKTQITGDWVAGKCINGTWEFFDGKPFFGVFAAQKVAAYTEHKHEVDQFHSTVVKETIASRMALLNTVFESYDHDKSQYLSVSELAAFCKLIDPHVSSQRLMSVIDTNRDRKIDRKEFIDYGLKMANATPGSVGGSVDQFSLAMKLSLAAKNWLKASASRALKKQYAKKADNKTDSKYGDSKSEPAAAAAAAVPVVSFCTESQLTPDVDSKAVARIESIVRVLASPADSKVFDKPAVKAFLLAMNEDIPDIETYADATIKKWGSTPFGFAEALLQSVLDGGGKTDYLDQSETAISKIQAAAGILTPQVVARIDSATRFVTADDGHGFELSRVRAWVNEIDDDIAGDADVAIVVKKIFGADPQAFKASMTHEVLDKRSLLHLEQVEKLISTLRKKLNLPGVSGTLIDTAVLTRIDNLVGLLSADVLPPTAAETAAAAAAAASAAATAVDEKSAPAPVVERRAYNPITVRAWICELDEDIAANPDTAIEEMKKDWGKDPKEFKTLLVRRLEQTKSLESLENAERAALTIRTRLKIPTEEEKIRSREKQRQLERDETDEDDSSFPDLTTDDWTQLFTIWVAARVGSLAGVTRLLAAAGPNSQIVNQKDAAGYTPLYYSLLCGHIRVTKLLLEKGALWDFRCFLATTKLSLKNLLKTQYSRQRVLEGSKLKPQNEDDDEQ